MPKLEIAEIEKKLNACLGSKHLDECGRQYGLEQRRHRGIPTSALVPSLLASLGSRKVETLADLHRDFQASNESTVNYKPFYEKLDKPGFVRVMKTVFSNVLGLLRLQMLKPTRSSPLGGFEDVIIHDGSSVTFHDALREVFPSRFTKVHPAGAELHVTLSLREQAAGKVQLAPDKESERKYQPPAASLRNKLLLADRGYRSAAYFSEIDQAGGFFAVRIDSTSNPTVDRVLSGSKRLRRQIGRPLNEALAHAPSSECADLMVTLPARGDRPACSFRLVVQKRRCRRDHKHKDTWMRIMTNVSPQRLSKQQLLQAYRLRWQIELFFKELKSYANLRRFCTRKKAIAEGLVWASLATIALKRYFAHACQLNRRIAAISSRRVAMCAHTFLPQVLLLLQNNSPRLTSALERTFAFLSVSARRANPSHERRHGLLALGLTPIGVT
jgi:hypothetical protein